MANSNKIVSIVCGMNEHFVSYVGEWDGMWTRASAHSHWSNSNEILIKARPSNFAQTKYIYKNIISQHSSWCNGNRCLAVSVFACLRKEKNREENCM